MFAESSPPDVEDPPGVKQVPGGLLVDQGDELTAGDLMKVQHRHAGRADAAQVDRIHLRGAEQRLARHVVDVDLQRGAAAQRGGEPANPFAAGVVARLAADGVALGGQSLFRAAPTSGRSAAIVARSSAPT